MRLAQLVLAVISFCCVVSVGLAQEGRPREIRLDGGVIRLGGLRVPPAEASPYSLSNLVQVKLDASESEAKFICLIESHRYLEEKLMPESPRAEVRKVTRVVPAGKKPLSIDWEKAKLYRLDGSLVQLDEAMELLSSLKPVFVAHSLNQAVLPANELLRQMVNEDALVLATDELRKASQPFPASFTFPAGPAN